MNENINTPDFNLKINEEQKSKIKIPLLNSQAPSFTAKSTDKIINFPQDFTGKYVILFSHPADFTPICSTEFILFADAYQQFQKLDTELIGLSADSLYSHIAWLRTIEEKLEYKGKSKVRIPFPVITDMHHVILKKYGMMHADNEFPARATFIIDPEGKIRAFMFYPMYNGRSIKEVLRILQAIQRKDNFGVATPGDWIPGDKVIDRIPRTFLESNVKMDNIPEFLKCTEWFSCFKSDPDEKGK